MLNALFTLLDGGKVAGAARAAVSMQRQGFLAATDFSWEGGFLRTWVHPSQREVENLECVAPDGAAHCVGPIWYRGQFGRAALRQLLSEVNANGCVDETALRGNFALFLRVPGHCWLLNDLPGFVRIYVSPDRLFYSTSWLATCAYTGDVELDEDAAVEYVLLGAAHSDRTVARGITTLPLASMFDMGARCMRGRPRIWLEALADVPVTLEAAVSDLSAHLQIVFGEVAAAFPARTRAALSGGFDSRLILAGLLAAGARPELFVYGDAASVDVPVARAVADSAGLSLEVIDKQALDHAKSWPDLECLVASALFFDGLPNDGIFDMGSDKQTRLTLASGGWMGLNGGGGEIFRNYFHLPGRPLSAMDIVRTFYRGFDRKVLRRSSDLPAYEERMATAILNAVDAVDMGVHRSLDRQCVELAYPLFRCHYWMAVNNSVATRHGYFTTPLVDPVSIGLTWRLPLSWKNAGLLESRLIKLLHPGVARQISEYGFSFNDGPSQRAYLYAWGNRMRPVFARPLVGALGRRLHQHVVASKLLAHCRALLPGDWRLDPLLKLQHLPDDQALARALAVEVVWRGLLS